MALKIGVVGMGGIGNTHADCYRNDALAKLVAVCDVVKEKAEAAAERHGVKAYYRLADMLANEHPDSRLAKEAHQLLAKLEKDDVE